MLSMALMFLTFQAVAASKPPGFYVLDPSDYSSNLREDFSWAVENVPFIDIPSMPDIQTAFYYRWRSYKRHIKYGKSPTWSGWVVTEFLPNVGWARKFNTIPAAAGHHISEGRWIANATYINDYLEFWFRGGGSPRTYTSWIAWAAWKRYLVNGDTSFITQLLPDLFQNLQGWKKDKFGSYGGRDCYYQTDGSDAMEVSISGSGCRPTLNSVIFGECVALLEIAKLAGNASVVAELTELREHMRSVVTEQMWNEESESFAVIPLPRPEPPPTPPTPPPPGFTPFNKGLFCCDQSKCVDGHSSFLYEGEHVCLTMDTHMHIYAIIQNETHVHLFQAARMQRRASQSARPALSPRAATSSPSTMPAKAIAWWPSIATQQIPSREGRRQILSPIHTRNQTQIHHQTAFPSTTHFVTSMMNPFLSTTHLVTVTMTTSRLQGMLIVLVTVVLHGRKIERLLCVNYWAICLSISRYRQRPFPPTPRLDSLLADEKNSRNLERPCGLACSIRSTLRLSGACSPQRDSPRVTITRTGTMTAGTDPAG